MRHIIAYTNNGQIVGRKNSNISRVAERSLYEFKSLSITVLIEERHYDDEEIWTHSIWHLRETTGWVFAHVFNHEHILRAGTTIGLRSKAGFLMTESPIVLDRDYILCKNGACYSGRRVLLPNFKGVPAFASAAGPDVIVYTETKRLEINNLTPQDHSVAAYVSNL